MARYIDADKFIAELEQEKTVALEFEDSVAVYEIEHTMNLIGMQPTADVIPKSEVEKLRSDCTNLVKLCEKFQLVSEKLQTSLKNAKVEVAREIFAEIGKILYKYDKIAERDKSEYGELIVGDIGSAIAELKKKYPISTEIVRDLAEYAVDQDIQNYKENK